MPEPERSRTLSKQVDKTLPLAQMFPDWDSGGGTTTGGKVRCEKGSPAAVAVDALAGGDALAEAKALLVGTSETGG